MDLTRSIDLTSSSSTPTPPNAHSSNMTYKTGARQYISEPMASEPLRLTIHDAFQPRLSARAEKPMASHYAAQQAQVTADVPASTIANYTQQPVRDDLKAIMHNMQELMFNLGKALEQFTNHLHRNSLKVKTTSANFTSSNPYQPASTNDPTVIPPNNSSIVSTPYAQVLNLESNLGLFWDDSDKNWFVMNRQSRGWESALKEETKRGHKLIRVWKNVGSQAAQEIVTITNRTYAGKIDWNSKRCKFTRSCTYDVIGSLLLTKIFDEILNGQNPT